MRRPATIAIWLSVGAALLGGAACRRHRARDGACLAHIDCDPGYDCRARICVKRPPIPGSAPVGPAVPTAPVDNPAAPGAGRGAEPSPFAPDPASDRPANRAPAPRPAPSDPTPSAPDQPAAPSELPMWKARLKNS